ncbi:MAG TPA: hypothetical protein VFP89_01375 [Propionibacteriaceae bacterium]|nr:hypothetical protein [Propionibacteriaceae bacterium]
MTAPATVLGSLHRTFSSSGGTVVVRPAVVVVVNGYLHGYIAVQLLGHRVEFRQKGRRLAYTEGV